MYGYAFEASGPTPFEAKLLRLDKYLRTYGPVVEKQIYTQDLNGIDQILQNLFRLCLAPSTKIL